jgi:hypothetical protein
VSFFDMLGGKPEKKNEQVATELFNGPAGDAESDVTDGIAKLMNYALRAKPEDLNGPFGNVGDKMVFQLKGVELGIEGSPEITIPAGDFEIELRRVG